MLRKRPRGVEVEQSVVHFCRCISEAFSKPTPPMQNLLVANEDAQADQPQQVIQLVEEAPVTATKEKEGTAAPAVILQHPLSFQGETRDGLLDAAPIAAALLNGDVGDVVVNVRLHGTYSLFRDADNFSSSLRQVSALGDSATRALEFYLLTTTTRTAYYVSDVSMSPISFIAALVASPQVSKIVFNGRSLYELLFTFLGTERVTIENVKDLRITGTMIRPMEGTFSRQHSDKDGPPSFAALCESHAAELFAEQCATPASSVGAVVNDMLHAVCLAAYYDDRIGLGEAAALETRADFLCAQMSYHGVLIDTARWGEAVRAVDDVIERLHGEANTIVAQECGETSVDIVNADEKIIVSLLLHDLKLESHVEDAKRMSLVQLIELLAPHHRLAMVLKEYRAAVHSRDVFAYKFRKFVQFEENGPDAPPRFCRVHPCYAVVGSRTGRIHASAPNLQNLERAEAPSPAGDGKKGLRWLIVSPPESTLVSFDYAQFELRILAALANDRALLSAFVAGSDPLKRIAAIAFKKNSENDVSAQERQATKTILYGIIYGLGDQALSAMIDASLSPRALRAAVAEAFSATMRYLEDVKSSAAFTKTAHSVSGRPRWLLDAPDPYRLGRTAVATVVQGSAADVLKCALWRLHKLRRKMSEESGMAPFVVLMTVHDEIVVAIESAQLAPTIGLIAHEMKCAAQDVRLDIALDLTVKQGPSLGELSPIAQ